MQSFSWENRKANIVGVQYHDIDFWQNFILTQSLISLLKETFFVSSISTEQVNKGSFCILLKSFEKHVCFVC